MGGAAGHMNHPFDLEWVNSGSDLLDFFNRAKTFVEEKKGGSIKVDGTNVSVKVVETPRGKEFALDRGSFQEIDLSGITISNFTTKWPDPEHGMRTQVPDVLTIFNAAIGDLVPELKELGMWDNSTIFLNMEYVRGKTNVIVYNSNFLAIHNLSQFYEAVAKSGPSKGNVRPGLPKPMVWDEKKKKEVPIKDKSTEIPYNRAVMARLIEKLKPYGEEYGFDIYGDVPTDHVGEIDYTGAISEPLTIRISDDREITKSVGEWLQMAKNPGYKSIKLKNGKMTHPYHKDLYKAISSGKEAVCNIIAQEQIPSDEECDWEDVVFGTVIMHATLLLGNEFLKGLTSPLGDTWDFEKDSPSHEGVVLRDPEIFGTQKPVKITGGFITGGTSSAFQKKTETPIIMKEEDEDEDPVVDIEFEDEPVEGETVAIVPGAFKPPHMGHVDMVEQYAQNADRVVVLISAPTRGGRKLPNGREITAEDSEKIWNLFVGSNPKIEVYKSSHASPINAAYEISGKGALREKIAEKIGMDPINAGDTVILGASNKGGDATRWTGARKYVGEDLELVDPAQSAVEPLVRSNGEPYSASDMRELLGDTLANKETLRDFAGDDLDGVLKILGMETLEEVSSGAGGSVAGAPTGPKGKGPWVNSKEIKKDNKEEEERQRLITRGSLAMAKENHDLSLVDDVIRLIMERGILQ